MLYRGNHRKVGRQPQSLGFFIGLGRKLKNLKDLRDFDCLAKFRNTNGDDWQNACWCQSVTSKRYLICLGQRQWRFWPWRHVRNSLWRAFSGQQSHHSEFGKDRLQACRLACRWRLESVLSLRLWLQRLTMVKLEKLPSHLHQLRRHSSQRSPWSRLRGRRKHRGTL